MVMVDKMHCKENNLMFNNTNRGKNNSNLQPAICQISFTKYLQFRIHLIDDLKVVCSQPKKKTNAESKKKFPNIDLLEKKIFNVSNFKSILVFEN